jgi:hypothetical protein
MRKVIVVLLALTILPVLSFAQVKGGDIYGSVVLDDGSKVPGVLITLTGEKIGTLTTISSEKGNFRFLALPPGGYELKCELEGFKTVIRKDIELSLGKSITLNILMETTPLKEEITVSGRVGVIDTRTTQVGVNVDKEWIESIPTARNPWTVLSALPGLMVDRVDVGGADSGQQSMFYAGGGTSDDTTWNVDGANITDPSAIGAAPAYMNINSYDELQVNLGSNDISAQTGGVQLNFVTKRAGNRTSGDFHLYVEDEKWEMNQDPTEYMVNRGFVVPGINRLYQYGVNVGGPIVKDKLWWFGSWAVQDIHKRTESMAEDATWLVSGYGKLNFQLGNTTGDFHLSYDAKLKWGRTHWSAAQQNSGSSWDQEGPGYLYYGGISHVFGDLMLNVKAVYTDGGFSLDPRGADIAANGHNEGADMLIVDWSNLLNAHRHYMTNRNSINASFDGNYFLEGALGGDHEIRFGVDYFTADTTTQVLWPNQRYLVTYTGQPGSNYFYAFSDYLSDVNFKRISAYIQDTITWGKLTASFGVRYDKESGGVNPSTQPPFTWYEPGSPHHGEQLWPDWNTALEISEPFKPDAAWSLISPRISFTYDITGDGKNVVKLSAARYMGQSGNTIGGAYAPYRWALVLWNDANADSVLTYGEMGPVAINNAFRSQDPDTGLNNVLWDPDYNTPLLDELVLKFEKALSDDLAVAVSGFYKKRHNLCVDYSTSTGRFVNVTKGIMADGNIETKENWVLIGNTTVAGTQVPTYEQIENEIGSYYYSKDKAYDTYIGLQFLMTKKLSNKWMANLSFTWQDWKRYRFEEEELNLNNFDFFNEAVMAESTIGSGLSDVFVNSRWMVKLTGMYQLPFGLNLTTFFQAREGNPQPLRSQIRLNQGTQRLYMANTKLGDQRLPTFWMLNLGLEKTFKVTDTVSATLCVDWYNATNNQIELKHNLYVGDEIDHGEPNPVMWTNAGLFQFGVRVNF